MQILWFLPQLLLLGISETTSWKYRVLAMVSSYSNNNHALKELGLLYY
jgi:hypothetical protein